MVMDGRYIYCGDLFVIYLSIKSLWYTPETKKKFKKFKNYDKNKEIGMTRALRVILFF